MQGKIAAAVREKIAVRTFIRISVLVVAISASYTAFFIMQQKRLLIDAMEREGESLARLLAHEVRLCMFVENTDTCSKTINGVIDHDNIVCVALHTPAGESLLRMTKQGLKADDSLCRRLPEMTGASSGGAVETIVSDDKGGAVEFWSSVVLPSLDRDEAAYIAAPGQTYADKVIGYVGIAIGKEFLFAQTRAVFGKGILLCIVFLVIGQTATYFIVRGITGPIIRLNDAAAAFGKGNFDAGVEITSADELGVLSRTFNRMAADIREHVGELSEAGEKIRALNEGLERKVEERTMKLKEAQEELIRKEKLAVLGQLAGSVSHELRTPLSVIGNSVYLLREMISESGGKIGEYLDIIDSEVDASQRIITDLLDFTRTRAPRSEAVSVREAVETALRSGRIPDSVMVDLDLPETLPRVKSDPLHMAQILGNLVRNAVEAMPGGGMLTIRASKDCGGGVRIDVKDTGKGISDEEMKMLFQPLFTTKQKGIGLGLSVSRKLAEDNGGRIDAASRPGDGALFSLTLPAEV